MFKTNLYHLKVGSELFYLTYEGMEQNIYATHSKEKEITFTFKSICKAFKISNIIISEKSKDALRKNYGIHILQFPIETVSFSYKEDVLSLSRPPYALKDRENRFLFINNYLSLFYYYVKLNVMQNAELIENMIHSYINNGCSVGIHCEQCGIFNISEDKMKLWDKYNEYQKAISKN